MSIPRYEDQDGHDDSEAVAIETLAKHRERLELLADLDVSASEYARQCLEVLEEANLDEPSEGSQT